MRTTLWITLAVMGCLLVAVLFFALGGPHTTVETTTESRDTTPTEPVTLYYYREAADLGAQGTPQCSRRGLVALERRLPSGYTLEDLLKLEMKGILTQEEHDSGISTEFPLPGVVLETVEHIGAKAVLTFKDPRHNTTGGACRTSVLWYQLEATALSYPGVEDVEFFPKTLFQP
jgi:hypothetical protein